MNYHFFIDEKFIDDFIADAKRVSTENVFIYTFQQPARHVKSDDGIFAPHGSAQLTSLLKEIHRTDKVFIHWYHKPIDQILLQIPKRTKVYLMLWGGDFFEYPPLAGYSAEAIKTLYDVRSYQRYKRYYRIKWKALLKNVWKDIMVLKIPKQWSAVVTRTYFKSIHQQRHKFLKRLSGVCHWNSYDIESLEQQYQVELKHLPFCYSVGETPEIVPPSKAGDIVFWLGNSDTITNNHLDALEVLKRFAKEKMIIFCPLNYGHRWYANIVAGRGRRIFHEKFQPIKNFIPREEYYKMMDRVDVAIMYHNRSQAGGNIVTFIMKGKKVYLKPSSPIYRLMRDLGVIVFSTEDLKEQTLEEISKPLSAEQAQQNHRILCEGIGSEAVRLQNLSAILNS